jgi:hypothetical protein
MRSIPSIFVGGVLYEAYINSNGVLIVRKVLQDSGVDREVSFDNLPKRVKNHILTYISK